MKTNRMRCAVALALGLAALEAGAAEKTWSVQVREGVLRDRPSFLGRPVASLGYGARVVLLEENQGWREVRDEEERRGWIHESALTPRKIKLQSGDDVATGASSDELALAGKGFSAEVEAKYRADHAGVDFTWIDNMEKIRITRRQMLSFLEEGRVSVIGEETP